jgi:hypothetical protein
MNKPKVYVKDFNNVMRGIIDSPELERVSDPRQADCLVLWNDVRGEMAELAHINRDLMKKPLVVVQHGVGGARDYEHPENFPLIADKFCCWGQHDYERLVRQGNGSKAVIVGSPLINQLKPREKHDNVNIVFCPIVTTHEEPANLITFYELKKIELDYAQNNLRRHKQQLINEWKPSIFDPENHDETNIPYYDINRNFRLVSKLTPIHDKSLYMGSVCQTSVGSSTHIEDCVKLLSMSDLVVGMVESTFQMLAMAMDIPVVICKEWEFKIYAGKDYTKCDHIKTDAVAYADVFDLRRVIEQELSNPERLKENRKKIVERELGDLNTNPDENIIKVIKEIVNG